MDQRDQKNYIERYNKRLGKYGYAPDTLGWGKHGRQEIRFGVLCHPMLKYPESSILDVGCGFADLYDFLITHGWIGTYCGIDINPSLLKIARERHSKLDLKQIDITSDTHGLKKYDFVVASGVFNARLSFQNNLRHIEKAMRTMYALSRNALCVDFLSTYVDYQQPDAWHTSPSWAFDFSKQLSKRVTMRHDYMPFEFAVYIYKDDSVSNRNVFISTENQIKNKTFA